jgi:hypothetical protein
MKFEIREFKIIPFFTFSARTLYKLSFSRKCMDQVANAITSRFDVLRHGY